jgi:hypothetical protein
VKKMKANIKIYMYVNFSNYMSFLTSFTGLFLT